MIKYVIFDWGGVCTRGHLIQDFASNLPPAASLDVKKVREVFNSPEEYSYETGLMEPEQFWAWFKNELGLEISAKEVQAIFLNSYVIDPAMLDYMLELKKEYKTALLTNNYRDMLDHIRETYRIEKYFDQIFSSSEIHLKKPDKEIYEHVIKKLGINPNEAIFVDDKERNTAAAQALGFKTVTFINLEDLKQKINLW